MSAPPNSPYEYVDEIDSIFRLNFNSDDFFPSSAIVITSELIAPITDD
jgi:hypothetical protein